MCPLNSQGYPDRYAPSKQRIRLEKTTTRNKQTNSSNNNNNNNNNNLVWVLLLTVWVPYSVFNWFRLAISLVLVFPCISLVWHSNINTIPSGFKLVSSCFLSSCLSLFHLAFSLLIRFPCSVLLSVFFLSFPVPSCFLSSSLFLYQSCSGQRGLTDNWNNRRDSEAPHKNCTVGGISKVSLNTNQSLLQCSRSVLGLAYNKIKGLLGLASTRW